MTDKNKGIDPVSQFIGETAQALKGINSNMTTMNKRQDSMAKSLGSIEGDIKVLKKKDSRLCDEVNEIKKECGTRKDKFDKRMADVSRDMNIAKGGRKAARVILSILFSAAILVVMVLSYWNKKETENIKAYITNNGFRDTIIQYPIPLIPDFKPPQ